METTTTAMTTTTSSFSSEQECSTPTSELVVVNGSTTPPLTPIRMDGNGNGNDVANDGHGSSSNIPPIHSMVDAEMNSSGVPHTTTGATATTTFLLCGMASQLERTCSNSTSANSTVTSSPCTNAIPSTTIVTTTDTDTCGSIAVTGGTTSPLTSASQTASSPSMLSSLAETTGMTATDTIDSEGNGTATTTNAISSNAKNTLHEDDDHGGGVDDNDDDANGHSNDHHRDNANNSNDASSTAESSAASSASSSTPVLTPGEGPPKYHPAVWKALVLVSQAEKEQQQYLQQQQQQRQQQQQQHSSRVPLRTGTGTLALSISSSGTSAAPASANTTTTTTTTTTSTIPGTPLLSASQLRDALLGALHWVQNDWKKAVEELQTVKQEYEHEIYQRDVEIERLQWQLQSVSFGDLWTERETEYWNRARRRETGIRRPRELSHGSDSADPANAGTHQTASTPSSTPSTKTTTTTIPFTAFPTFHHPTNNAKESPLLVSQKGNQGGSKQSQPAESVPKPPRTNRPRLRQMIRGKRNNSNKNTSTTITSTTTTSNSTTMATGNNKFTITTANGTGGNSNFNRRVPPPPTSSTTPSPTIQSGKSKNFVNNNNSISPMRPAMAPTAPTTSSVPTHASAETTIPAATVTATAMPGNGTKIDETPSTTTSIPSLLLVTPLSVGMQSTTTCPATSKVTAVNPPESRSATTCVTDATTATTNIDHDTTNEENGSATTMIQYTRDDNMSTAKQGQPEDTNSNDNATNGTKSTANDVEASSVVVSSSQSPVQSLDGECSQESSIETIVSNDSSPVPSEPATSTSSQQQLVTPTTSLGWEDDDTMVRADRSNPRQEAFIRVISQRDAAQALVQQLQEMLQQQQAQLNALQTKLLVQQETASSASSTAHEPDRKKTRNGNSSSAKKANSSDTNSREGTDDKRRVRRSFLSRRNAGTKADTDKDGTTSVSSTSSSERESILSSRGQRRRISATDEDPIAMKVTTVRSTSSLGSYFHPVESVETTNKTISSPSNSVTLVDGSFQAAIIREPSYFGDKAPNFIPVGSHPSPFLSFQQPTNPLNTISHIIQERLDI